MSLSESIRSSFLQWVTFRGKTSRSEYWLFQLFLFIGTFGGAFFVVLLAIFAGSFGAGVGMLALALFWLIIAFPLLTITVRRLRDAGFSWGWLFLNLLPFGFVAVLFMLLRTSLVRRSESSPAGESDVLEPVTSLADVGDHRSIEPAGMAGPESQGGKTHASTSEAQRITGGVTKKTGRLGETGVGTNPKIKQYAEPSRRTVEITEPSAQEPGEAITLGEAFKAVLGHLDKPDVYFGLGFAGLFNVESGYAEVKTHIFERCSCDFSFLESCDTCGRTRKSSFSFRAGPGDGAYIGIGFWRDRAGADMAGCLYLFEDSYAPSPLISGEISTVDYDSLTTHFLNQAGPYLALPARQGATIEAGSRGFWLGDVVATPNEGQALIEHWGSENKHYRAVVFCESLLESPAQVSSDSEARAPSSEPVATSKESLLIPRALLMVEESIAVEIFKATGSLLEVDWSRQEELGQKRLVRSHISGARINLVAMRVMSDHWWNVREKHCEQYGSDDTLTLSYGVTAFGWMIQAVIFGLDEGRGRLLELLKKEPTLADVAPLSETLKMRGQDLNSAVEKLVQELKSELDEGVILPVRSVAGLNLRLEERIPWQAADNFSARIVPTYEWSALLEGGDFSHLPPRRMTVSGTELMAFDPWFFDQEEGLAMEKALANWYGGDLEKDKKDLSGQALLDLLYLCDIGFCGAWLALAAAFRRSGQEEQAFSAAKIGALLARDRWPLQHASATVEHLGMPFWKRFRGAIESGRTEIWPQLFWLRQQIRVVLDVADNEPEWLDSEIMSWAGAIAYNIHQGFGLDGVGGAHWGVCLQGLSIVALHESDADRKNKALERFESTALAVAKNPDMRVTVDDYAPALKALERYGIDLSSL